MFRKVFSTGSGRLDAQTLNEMAQAGYAHAEHPNVIPVPPLDGPYMALINPPNGDDKVEIAWLDTEKTQPIKWAYDWLIVSPEYTLKDGDETLAQANSSCYVSQFIDGGTQPSALNLCELNNSDSSLMGVNPNNLPEGFSLQPVPQSTHAMVWLYTMPYDPDTQDPIIPGDKGVIAYFTFNNQFDGECPS